jgi:hypothetical protein
MAGSLPCPGWGAFLSRAVNSLRQRFGFQLQARAIMAGIRQFSQAVVHAEDK